VTALRPENLFELEFLRDARRSPDGRHIAYSVSRTDEAEHFDIYVADAQGQNRQRLPYSGNATAPRWSADGRSIAFVGDGQLRVAAGSSWVLSAPVLPPHLIVQGAPSWSPDGTRIAVCVLDRRVTESPRHIARNHFRVDGYGYLDAFDQYICEATLSNGAMRRLSPAARAASQPQWSPCGRRVLFMANEGPVPLAARSPRLFTVDVDTAAVHETLGARWCMGAAVWLPGGKRIAVTAARDSTLTIPNYSLWVVDYTGGDAQLRTPDLPGTLGFRTHHDMPAWDLTQGNVITVLDEHTAFVSAQRRGSVEVLRVALDGRIAVEPVLCGPRSCIVLDACSTAEHESLLYAVTDFNTPLELYTADLNGRHEQRLSHLNDEVLARWPQLRTEPFTVESAGDLTLDSWFLSAAERALPLPTILFIHGGPFGAVGYAFNFDFYLLASHGFGIVFANFRGSAGYGDDFTRAIMGDWGGLAYPDHIGAIEGAVARGFADPERLGVWGGSYGGFATCWIVGHTQRFKAAMAQAACTDFTTLYHHTDLPDVFRFDLGGSPHEIPEIYRARSPLTYAHRCRTPTLLVHGEDDLRCPIGESEQFHRVLHDVGCTAELVRIPGCTHLGDSLGPLAARRTQNEVLLEWFQRYL
jgi:dipeptidyl aminopeptidase/acylaminoacyl peptidase